MFRRRNSDQHRSTSPRSKTDWNPIEVRNALFTILGKRLGTENGKVLREDFDKHVAADPVHGIEQGYVCLLGKLIEYTDALSETTALGNLLGGPTPTSGEIPGVNAFSVFRKER